MPRKANIGEQIEQYLLEQGANGATILDISEGVGCVRQTPATWLKSHAGKVVVAGKTDTGAKIFVHRDNAPEAMKVNIGQNANGKTRTRVAGSMQVGDVLTLTSVGLSLGRIVVTLQATDGVEYVAIIEPDA